MEVALKTVTFNSGEALLVAWHDETDKKIADLFLMDLQMPELDGYQATARIRLLEDTKYKNLSIIALTASAMPDIREAVFEAGMNDYKSKPFDPADVYRKIAAYKHADGKK